MKRTIAATAVVTLLGIGALWAGTDGLQAFTSETARRLEIQRHPKALPDVALEDQDGRVFTLADYRGRFLLVEFIYTRCLTICRSLGMAFKQISDNVPPEKLGRDLALLSISFDPVRDGPPELKSFGMTHGADGSKWRIARVRDKSQLQSLLNAFGIVVIPDGRGGFEHNAAIHLLDRTGRLVLISDIDSPLPLARKIVASL